LFDRIVIAPQALEHSADIASAGRGRSLVRGVRDIARRQCRHDRELAVEMIECSREVAELLQVSVKTVENQMSLAFKKIGTAINLKLPHLTAVFSKN
jgi:hypothetical protein